MSSEVTKKTPVDLDGFSGGYSEPARSGEGGGEGDGSGFPGAIKLKFTNEAEWVDRNGDVVRSALVALDVVNRVQKWDGSGGPPLETITLAPGQAWPDIDALNENCRSEWYEKFGKDVGPWAGEHVMLLVDPDSMTRYWWPSPTATIGACVCIRTLMNQVKDARRFKHPQAYALVELSHTHMPTQYGGRERAYLPVKGWVVFDDGGYKVLPSTPPTAKQITGDSVQF